MKRKVLYGLWAGMFILCAGLGFIPNSEGIGRAVLVALAVLFFAPGAAILWLAAKEKNPRAMCWVRNLSTVSLGLTLICLIINFLSIGASEAAGRVLHGLLVIVSAPMFCGQYWVLGMFGWACLLIASLSCLKKAK